MSLELASVEAPELRRQSRMVDRTASFMQSRGQLDIKRLDDDGQTSWLSWNSRFHGFLYMSTWKVIIICVTVIVSSWLSVAGLFFAVSRRCGLDAGTFLRSLYLAIETVESVGYGVPDSYFNNCHSGVFVLGAASLWSTLLNAVIVTIVYARISRPNKRATSVCYSEKAIIRTIGGNCYFMFQICDFRKQQLVEAHVRLYSVQHADTSSGVAFQTRAMRLQHPDDELGGMLLLALPQLVVHRIDPWSPLCPESCRRRFDSTPASSFQFPDIPQRAADGENGNRDPGPEAGWPRAPEVEEIAGHMARGEIEVLCCVEGIEPATSSTLQARHSYTRDDVVLNASFRRCVSREAGGSCRMDFSAFHEVVPQAEGDEVLVQSMP